jgi:hypothetical protein
MLGLTLVATFGYVVFDRGEWLSMLIQSRGNQFYFADSDLFGRFILREIVRGR